MHAKTYHPQGGLNKLPQTLREFGEQQNQLNAELRRENESLKQQIEILGEHLGEAIVRIQALEDAITALREEQELNIKRFHRCAEDLDKAEQEIGRLRLTARLNTNAIDRLTRQEDKADT